MHNKRGIYIPSFFFSSPTGMLSVSRPGYSSPWSFLVRACEGSSHSFRQTHSHVHNECIAQATVRQNSTTDSTVVWFVSFNLGYAGVLKKWKKGRKKQYRTTKGTSNSRHVPDRAPVYYYNSCCAGVRAEGQAGI